MSFTPRRYMAVRVMVLLLAVQKPLAWHHLGNALSAAPDMEYNLNLVATGSWIRPVVTAVQSGPWAGHCQQSEAWSDLVCDLEAIAGHAADSHEPVSEVVWTSGSLHPSPDAAGSRNTL